MSNCVFRDSENSCAPTPDVFRKKITMNSFRMSLRKRVPLKRINGNTQRNEWKEEDANKSNATKKQPVVSNASAKKQSHGIEMERSVKKTFYRVTEHITGGAKKSQLKVTSDISTPRTRYRERMRTPPMTPQSPTPYDTPVCVSPLPDKNILKRTPYSRKRRSTTPLETGENKIGRDSDHFSNHLELISCGIQHLETNEKQMTAAIRSMGLEYLSSPLHPKFKRKNTATTSATTSAASSSDFTKRRITRSVTDSQLEQSSNKCADKNVATARSKLSRSITRMSMRVKGRSYSSKFPNEPEQNTQAECYIGPSYHK